MTYKNMYKYVFVVIFLGVLLFPLTNMNEEGASETENRNLAPVPDFFVDGSINKSFCKDAETWLRDRFTGRSVFLLANKVFASSVMSDDFHERVLKGDEGWLFYKGNDSVANYQNKNLFSQEELETIKNNTLKKKQIMKKAGIDYYLFISPDKNRVYGEYYPSWIEKVADEGRAEQLVKYLRDNGVDVIYPLEEMIQAKNKYGAIYHRIDTHWTSLGAFVGYTALMEAIQKDHPDIKMLHIDDFNINQVEEAEGDLLTMLDVPLDTINIPDNHIAELDLENRDFNYYTVEHKGKYGRDGVITKNDKPLNDYKVFVVRDSYTIALIPYISESFAAVDYMWSRKFGKYTGEIIKAKPDIVVEQMVERYIPVLVSNINK